MTKKNSNLHAAKKAKNDEFYTRLADIEKELKHYRTHFQGKKVYLNCDSAKSEFWRFFCLQFNFLGLEKLTATHYSEDGSSYKLELTKEMCEGVLNPHTDIEPLKTDLVGDGDFRSEESLAILSESDIVVTNPPFSLFREFVEILNNSGKKYLVVGSMNAITYKEVFKLIKENKLWLGNYYLKEFTKPDGTTQKFGNILWYTNMDHSKRNEDLILFREYSSENYPTYDNYNAINVDKVKDIPEGFLGEVGVPITFLSQYNPNQFKIVKFRKGDDGKDLRYITDQGLLKEPYFRVIIKRK